MNIYKAVVQPVWSERSQPIAGEWELLAKGGGVVGFVIDKSILGDYSFSARWENTLIVVSALEECQARSLALAWLHDREALKALAGSLAPEQCVEDLLAAHPVESVSFMGRFQCVAPGEAAELLRKSKLSPGLGVRVAYSDSLDSNYLEHEGADLLIQSKPLLPSSASPEALIGRWLRQVVSVLLPSSAKPESLTVERKFLLYLAVAVLLVGVLVKMCSSPEPTAPAPTQQNTENVMPAPAEPQAAVNE